jgi:hypothetical protein
METSENPQESQTTVEEDAAELKRPESPEPDLDAVKEGEEKLDQAGGGH